MGSGVATALFPPKNAHTKYTQYTRNKKIAPVSYTSCTSKHDSYSNSRRHPQLTTRCIGLSPITNLYIHTPRSKQTFRVWCVLVRWTPPPHPITALVYSSNTAVKLEKVFHPVVHCITYNQAGGGAGAGAGPNGGAQGSPAAKKKAIGVGEGAAGAASVAVVPSTPSPLAAGGSGGRAVPVRVPASGGSKSSSP